MDSDKSKPKTIAEAKQSLREATTPPDVIGLIKANPLQSLLVAGLAGAVFARFGTAPLPTSLLAVALKAVSDLD